MKQLFRKFEGSTLLRIFLALHELKNMMTLRWKCSPFVTGNLEPVKSKHCPIDDYGEDLDSWDGKPNAYLKVNDILSTLDFFKIDKKDFDSFMQLSSGVRQYMLHDMIDHDGKNLYESQVGKRFTHKNWRKFLYKKLFY